MSLAALVALAAATSSCGAAVRTDEAAASSYAFSSELGSGIYDVSGRTVQVYRVVGSHSFRDAAAPGDPPGIRLTLPLTVGFFDFRPEDVFSAGLPKGLGTVSVVPGVEFEFVRSERWRIVPYVRAGYAFASGSDADATLVGTGIRSEYERPGVTWQISQRTELRALHADFRGCLRNDSFVRLRNAVEARRDSGRTPGGRQIEVGFFGVFDYYVDPPREPVGGAVAPRVQIEAGVMFGLRPAPEFKGVAMPRIGIGWREAGPLSGWRLVFGHPF